MSTKTNSYAACCSEARKADADDNIDTITKRLQVYHKQTAPLRDYYTNKGSFHPIDGNRTVDGDFDSIKLVFCNK